MTAQDIVNAVSVDTRQVLQPSGNDANVILNWVDRIQKEILHSSLYVNTNLATTQIQTVAGQAAYTVSVSPGIRRLVSIYDTTFNMSLTPSDVDLDQPTPTQAHVDESAGRPASQSPLPYQAYKLGGTAEYYRFIAPSTILIRPVAATSAYTSLLSVVYEQLVQTVSSLSTTLLIPDDGKDILCAGVNWMAMAYIGRSQEAMSWFQLYQQLKTGERVGVIR